MSILKKEFVLDETRMPKHVACIMDGNGRWAKKRGLPRTAGHKVGVDRVLDIINACKELRIEVVTVFAFSTENWKRNEEEISYIFKLLEDMVDSRLEYFKKENVKVTMIGTLDRLIGKYDSLKEKLERVLNETRYNNGLIFNIAFNYGSHDEIVGAVRNICKDVNEKRVQISDIDESLFESYLMTKGLPDIDLMIRTSGECRLSNFLLWQLAYSELVFTKTAWPDFDGKELRKCILEYQTRNRRFGNLN